MSSLRIHVSFCSVEIEYSMSKIQGQSDPSPWMFPCAASSSVDQIKANENVHRGPSVRGAKYRTAGRMGWGEQPCPIVWAPGRSGVPLKPLACSTNEVAGVARPALELLWLLALSPFLLQCWWHEFKNFIVVVQTAQKAILKAMNHFRVFKFVIPVHTITSFNWLPLRCAAQSLQ